MVINIFFFYTFLPEKYAKWAKKRKNKSSAISSRVAESILQKNTTQLQKLPPWCSRKIARSVCIFFVFCMPIAGFQIALFFPAIENWYSWKLPKVFLLQHCKKSKKIYFAKKSFNLKKNIVGKILTILNLTQKTQSAKKYFSNIFFWGRGWEIFWGKFLAKLMIKIRLSVTLECRFWVAAISAARKQ